jgi:DNA-directed RNA polymerase subunit RPC12/RpoP
METKDYGSFVCAECEEEFERAWSDEEARAEQRADFPNVPIEKCAEVCEDCYSKLMKARSH